MRIILIFSILISTQLHAGNSLKARLMEWGAEKYLKGIFTTFVNTSSPHYLQGLEAIETMFQTLDYDSFRQLVFQKEYWELVRSEEIQNYAKESSKAIQKAKKEKTAFNLWDWTLTYFNGNHNRAIQVIGLLFQSYEQRWYNRLATAQPDAMALITIDRLYDIAKILHTSKSKSITRLPSWAGPEKNPSWYHFYVPAYQAMKIAKTGVSPHLAFFAAFLFNTAYEIRGIRDSNLPRWSKPIDRQQHWDPLFDIYMGYAGIRFALSNGTIETRQRDFEQTFSENPRAFMEKELKSSGFSTASSGCARTRHSIFDVIKNILR